MRQRVKERERGHWTKSWNRVEGKKSKERKTREKIAKDKQIKRRKNRETDIFFFNRKKAQGERKKNTFRPKCSLPVCPSWNLPSLRPRSPCPSCQLRIKIESFWSSEGSFLSSEGLFWCSKGLFWCSKGLFWCSKELFWCSEGLFWCSEGSFWCSKGSYWSSEGLFGS